MIRVILDHSDPDADHPKGTALYEKQTVLAGLGTMSVPLENEDKQN